MHATLHVTVSIGLSHLTLRHQKRDRRKRQRITGSRWDKEEEEELDTKVKQKTSEKD